MTPNLSASDYAMNAYNWLRERGIAHKDAMLLANVLMIQFNDTMMLQEFDGVREQLNKRVSN